MQQILDFLILMRRMGCHHRCKVNPPTTGKETHLAVIYSLPRGNYFSFQKPSKPVGKGLLKEKIVSFQSLARKKTPIKGGSTNNGQVGPF